MSELNNTARIVASGNGRKRMLYREVIAVNRGTEKAVERLGDVKQTAAVAARLNRETKTVMKLEQESAVTDGKLESAMEKVRTQGAKAASEHKYKYRAYFVSRTGAALDLPVIVMPTADGRAAYEGVGGWVTGEPATDAQVGHVKRRLFVTDEDGEGETNVFDTMEAGDTLAFEKRNDAGKTFTVYYVGAFDDGAGGVYLKRIRCEAPDVPNLSRFREADVNVNTETANGSRVDQLVKSGLSLADAQLAATMEAAR